MKGSRILMVAGIVLILAGAAAALPTFVPQFAALPHWTSFDGIWYQAQLNDADGQPVPDGPHTFVFSLWDDPTTGNRLWEETQSIELTGGLLGARLGAVTPILVDSLGMPGGDTLRLFYFEVAIDGETISPRSRLTAMPFARVAERLLGDLESGKGLLRIRDDDGGIPFELNHDLDGTSAYIVDSFFDIEYRVSFHTADSGAYLTVANLGSSGQDGVRSYSRPSGSGTYAIDSFFDITYRVDLVASDTGAVLRVMKKDTNGDNARGLTILSDVDSTGLYMVDSFFDIEYRIDFQGAPGGALGGWSSTRADGSSSQVRVRSDDARNASVEVSNLGSSGEDGVRIAVDDIGPSLVMVDSTGGGGLDGLKTYEFTMRPDRIEITKGAVADPDTTKSELGHDHLIISNIGSSGQDGVRIDVGPDGTGVVQSRLFLGDLSVPDDGDGARVVYGVDSTVVGLLYGGGGGAGGSARMWTSVRGGGVRTTTTDVTGGETSVLLGDGRIRLAKRAVGGTWDTEILSMSLSASEPVIGVRPGGSAPTDPFALEVSQSGDLTVRSFDPVGTERLILLGDGRISLRENTGSWDTEILSMSLTGAEPVVTVRPLGSAPSDPASFTLTDRGSLYLFGGARLAEDPTSQVVIGPGPAFVTLTVNGEMCATGGVVACSDRRFKKNIDAIENPIEKVLNLRGVNFNWRTEEFDDRQFSDDRQIGFIAQDVLEVLPEVVVEGVDGYYAVDYSRITPLLVEAVKEQQKTIDELRAKITENERLQDRLSSLESIVEALLAERNNVTTGQDKLAAAN